MIGQLRSETTIGAVDAPETFTLPERSLGNGEWSEAQMWLLRGGIIAAFLALWQATSGRVVNAFWFSDPASIAHRWWQWFTNGTLAFNFFITLEEMAIGFVFGVVLGSIAGFVLGRQRFVARLLDPLILGVASVPKIALAPLFILWFGVGMLPKIVMAGAVVFFLVFFNTYSGVRDADPDLIDVVHLMGGRRLDVMRFVLVPSALAWIFTGLKIAVPYALVGAVVGEMMASNKGLGALIQSSAAQFDTAGVFAALATLLVLSIGINELLGRVERRVLRWKGR